MSIAAMRIAALLPLTLLAAAGQAPAGALDGLPLAALPRQDLPATGCAAYLFAPGSRTLLAMATADPARLRLAIDGRIADLPRQSQQGTGGYGFSGTTAYRAGDVTAVLDMTIANRSDLTGGAAVPQALLSIDRAGRDGVALPVAGLIGCAA